MHLKVDDFLNHNRYQILRVLSDQGGMGKVYLAIDCNLGDEVVVKQSRFSSVDSLRHNPNYRGLTEAQLQSEVASLQQDFEREAKLLRRLRHDALPRVLDYFKTEDARQFLVMEFIPGQDFSELLEERQRRGQGACPVAQVLDWAAQILDALVYLHTNFNTPIIHRDIKPQNLKLMPQGRVVLLDFGLAKGAPSGLSFAAASVPGSSPLYSPLEQTDEQGTDVRSDLYSLAVTLHHLLTGQTPPGATTRAGKMLSRQPDPLRLAHELNPQVPPSVSTVLQKAAAIIREDRYPNAKAMREALQQAATTVPTPGIVTAPEIGVETVVRPRTRQRIVVPFSRENISERQQSYTENLNGVPLEMILVPAGKFMMGSDKYDWEKPPHEISVPSFYMGKFQVTQRQWKAVMGANPSYFKGDELPVEQVSWDDAQAFCEKRRAMTSKTYRLPSEAEWEYACRAGTTGDYAGKLDEMAWYDKNSGGKAHPVGQKKPNAFGLYDMHGNVWEWCEDVAHDNYDGAPRDGSAWLGAGSGRVLRSGSWSSAAASCRSAFRQCDSLGDLYNNLGFCLLRH